MLINPAEIIYCSMDNMKNADFNSELLTKELYERNYEITVNNEVFEIPIEGSLGLLASGYEGLTAWRKVCLHNYT